MSVTKKKTSDLQPGDIMIIDYRIFSTTQGILLNSTSKKGISKIEKKCEGESKFFLFEIDDIDDEYIDGSLYTEGMSEEESEKIPTMRTLYHMDALYDNNITPSIRIMELYDYVWNVISDYEL